MIFGDGNRNQLAFLAALQRMDHPERQRIIDIVADIGIEDQRNRFAATRLSKLRTAEQANNHKQAPRYRVRKLMKAPWRGNRGI